MQEFQEKIKIDFKEWGQVLNVGELTEEIKKVLNTNEFNRDNSRLIFSVCSDDCNRLAERETIEKSLTKMFGREFHLGGLAGYPIGGVSGIIAASHHVPNKISVKFGKKTKGNLIFFVSPHLGLIKMEDFFYGRLIRPCQQSPTPCCGAMMVFLTDLKQAGDLNNFMITPDINHVDPTKYIFQKVLINEYANQLNKILNMDNINSQIIKLIKVNYKMISQKVTKMINEFFKRENESFQGKIAIISGITINCSSRDFFVLKEINSIKN